MDRWARSDGVVTIRPPRPGDAATLVAGRDEVFHRWLGPGAEHPEPTAVVEVDGSVVGWVDADDGCDWLGPGEVNVGWALAPAARGRGWATRAVQLLLLHLAEGTAVRTATVRVDPANEPSLAVARRTGFVDVGTAEGQRCLRRPVGR